MKYYTLGRVAEILKPKTKHYRRELLRMIVVYETLKAKIVEGVGGKNQYAVSEKELERLREVGNS